MVPDQPFSAFLATAHEWGHSLYEQGLPRGDDHYFPWPLGEATSMGVHESQSLFWECRVARSQAFANRWHPRFCGALGSDPWGGSHPFWRGLNPMRPGLIRVEADELTYCLHIVLRFELELALVEQGLPVVELPELWNRRMGELLGLRPQRDAEGCLQDIHWAEGLFGYFPSYALGHLISAQLAETMERELGPIESAVGAAQELQLQHWLGENVWPLGRIRQWGRAGGQGHRGAPERQPVPALPLRQGRSAAGVRLSQQRRFSRPGVRKMPPQPLRDAPWRTSTTPPAAPCSTFCMCCRRSPMKPNCG